MASPFEHVIDDGDDSSREELHQNICGFQDIIDDAYDELIADTKTVDDENELIYIDDVIAHIEDHYRKQEKGHADSSSKSRLRLSHRLLKGNMSLSHKKKCSNIVKKGIARGASTVTKSSLKGSMHKVMTIPTSKNFEDICECILKALIALNCGTLVQEKWLTETRRLLHAKEMSIGVFGRHKAGKSTVLNALLHQEILPSAITNETATLTKICHDKSKHISGSKNCIKENCPNCPTWGEISGRRNIRHKLQDMNISIRTSAEPLTELRHHAVIALVPFMSRYPTGNIKPVLMDTPGLAEANELGITDIAEHQLMTCSAYIYVISCTQLEDEIDSETLTAIVERDPGVFEQRRLLIVVTRLDEYKEARKRTNDCNDAKANSDEEDTPDFENLIRSIRKLVQKQFKLICSVNVPDDCIIPVSATGALEARKELNGLKSEDADGLLLNFKKRVGRRLSIEELDHYSQVQILETRMGEMLFGAYSYPVWKDAIVRDCSRYLYTAIKVLQEVWDTHEKVEKDFVEKYVVKVKKWKDFKERSKACKETYQLGSKFHKSLESAYDTDMESHQSSIKEKCQEEFTNFEHSVRQRKHLKSQEYRDLCETFLEDANKSLLFHFERLQFQNVNKVIRKSFFHLGEHFKDLETLIIAFCEANVTALSEDEKSIETRTNLVPIENAPAVTTAPLELKDLLEHGKSVKYTVLDRIKILAQRIFLRITIEDPDHELLDTERDTLLSELKISLVEDSIKYFDNVKKMIISGYIEEHITSIENHITELRRRYASNINEMTGRVKFWRNNSDAYRILAGRYKEEIEFLKQLQVLLEPIFR